MYVLTFRLFIISLDLNEQVFERCQTQTWLIGQKDQKPVRKSSTVELEELKEKGKKVLKKIIPNQPLILIKKLVQKGADNFKKELRLNHQLLPSLTTNKIQSLTTKQSVMGNINSDTYESSHFEQMNRQLTHTMLNFQSTLSE